MEEEKWYLGMRLVRKKNYISLDQDQYVKDITVNFEKNFKHPFKGRQSILPTNFTPAKRDNPTTKQ